MSSLCLESSVIDEVTEIAGFLVSIASCVPGFLFFIHIFPRLILMQSHAVLYSRYRGGVVVLPRLQIMNFDTAYYLSQLILFHRVPSKFANFPKLGPK